MKKRENLNKLDVPSLRLLASDHGIEVKKKKKADLVSDILTHQTPTVALTPIVSQVSPLEGTIPSFDENLNLPPYHRVSYRSPSENPLPLVSFSQLYNFMIARPKTDGGTAGNFKGLDRAVKHYEAGDVQNIGVSKIGESTVYVKANCQASMKKQQYQVYVCLTSDREGTTTIQHAYCQCPIGLAQACSHNGSLLFALSNARPQSQLPGTEAALSYSCTSQPCKWNVPNRQSKPTCPISTLNFDPRHSSDRDFDINQTLKHLTELRNIFPNTGMTHLWNIPSDHVPEALEEVEVSHEDHPMFKLMKNIIYSPSNMPPMTITQDLREFIEEHTREQRLSDMWVKLHLGRLTSSIFGDVLHAGANPKSLIKQIVEGSSLNKYTTLPAAVQWGVDHEADAMADYVSYKAALNSNFRVQDTGLTLCDSFSFLGASSDGKVFDEDSVGLLEIKCPYSIDGNIVKEAEVIDMINMGHTNFCLEASAEGPKLKRTHKYFAQVQGEMAILGLPWCDFVVWSKATNNNLVIDRVQFDEEFVKSMMPKLVEFYVKHVADICYHL